MDPADLETLDVDGARLLADTVEVAEYVVVHEGLETRHTAAGHVH